MVKINVTEADLDKSVRELVERDRFDDSELAVDGKAARVVRVPAASGVVFHPSGPARTGGFNHLGLKLED